jgi:hypothetical protein
MMAMNGTLNTIKIDQKTLNLIISIYPLIEFTYYYNLSIELSSYYLFFYILNTLTLLYLIKLMKINKFLGFKNLLFNFFSNLIFIDNFLSIILILNILSLMSLPPTLNFFLKFKILLFCLFFTNLLESTFLLFLSFLFSFSYLYLLLLN